MADILNFPQQLMPPTWGAEQPMQEPQVIRAPLFDKPPKSFIDRATEWIADWCASSKEYVDRYIPDIQLALDDYHQRIGLREFRLGARWRSEINGRRDFESEEPEGYEWSDFLYPIAPAISTFQSNAYNSIFDGPEWLTIVSHPISTTVTEDRQFPTAYKVQTLLQDLLRDGRIHSSLAFALGRAALLPAVCAKVFWHKHLTVRRYLNMETKQYEYHEDIASEYPVVELIPLDLWLPDWMAKNDNIQRWTGIGHRVHRTYEEVLNSFNRGIYYLNKSEFKDRFQDGGGQLGEVETIDQSERATSVSSDTLNRLELWEWHGKVPSENGQWVECVATYATEIGVDSPRDGVLIRLTQEPVMDCGLRPFALFNWRNDPPGPFGMSLVDEVREIRYLLSQFLGRLQDHAAFSVTSGYQIRKNSPIWGELKNKKTIPPGSILPVSEVGHDIAEIPSPGGSMQPTVTMANTLQDLYQRVSTITETFQGISKNEKTATESHYLQQQSMAPFSSTLHRFARDFLEPLLNLSLELVVQHIVNAKDIMINDDTGTPVRATITKEELLDNKFRVVSVLTRKDNLSTSKIQVIQQLLQSLPQFQPILQQEGWVLSVAQLLKKMVELFNVDGGDRILRKVTDREQQMQQYIQQLEQMLGQVQQQMPQGPPQAQQGSPPQQTPQGPEGGPMGPSPDELNRQMQMVQEQARIENQGYGGM